MHKKNYSWCEKSCKQPISNIRLIFLVFLRQIQLGIKNQPEGTLKIGWDILFSFLWATTWKHFQSSRIFFVPCEIRQMILAKIGGGSHPCNQWNITRLKKRFSHLKPMRLESTLNGDAGGHFSGRSDAFVTGEKFLKLKVAWKMGVFQSEKGKFEIRPLIKKNEMYKRNPPKHCKIVLAFRKCHQKLACFYIERGDSSPSWGA